MAANYYVRFDDNNKPETLLRALNGIVAVWNKTKQEFVDTNLSELQLGGLGGSADYRRLRKPAEHVNFLAL